MKTELHFDELLARSRAYNALHGTEYTTETYNDARTRCPLVMAWDEGWECCRMDSPATMSDYNGMISALKELVDCMELRERKNCKLSRWESAWYRARMIAERHKKQS